MKIIILVFYTYKYYGVLHLHLLYHLYHLIWSLNKSIKFAFILMT